MENSDCSIQPRDRLENSTTITINVQLVEDDLNQSPENTDLKGSFSVHNSSDEPLESEKGDELDKSLTLVKYPLSRNFGEEIVCDDMITDTKDSVENKEVNEIKPIEQNAEDRVRQREETPVVSDEDILIETTDQVDADDRKDKIENSGTKQIINPKAPGKPKSSNNNNRKKYLGKGCDPVVELDEAVEDNEPLKRNNKEESGQRRVSVTSPLATGVLDSQVPVQVESGKERKHSTGEVVSKNSCPLSLHSSAKGARPSRTDSQITPINRNENRLPAIINTDERTSNNKKSNRINSRSSNINVKVSNTSVNRTRCHSSHGERIRNPKLQHRNNSLSRSYDKSVNILGSQNSIESSERHRPVSVFEQRYTTRELRKALPRKSFFSCHERAMKDAGFETDDPEKRRKAERLKARLERIANEFSPLPSARGKQENNGSPGVVNDAVNITINDGDDFIGDKMDNGIDTVVSNINSDIGAGFNDIPTENISSKQETSKLLVKPTHRKRPGSARQEHIECKPLIQYLEYVKENRDEYLHHSHANTSNSKSNPVSRLISLGKAFELRHLGGIPRRQDDDIIVMAAKALRPRCSDPAKYTKIDRDKSATHRGQESLRQARPPSEDKRKQESHAKEEEHIKTELERKRIKAEEWTKSVSTNTLTKAKIQSLRELGADDNEIMKWWDAFRSCRYLRDTGPVEEKVS